MDEGERHAGQVAGRLRVLNENDLLVPPHRISQAVTNRTVVTAAVCVPESAPHAAGGRVRIVPKSLPQFHGHGDRASEQIVVLSSRGEGHVVLQHSFNPHPPAGRIGCVSGIEVVQTAQNPCAESQDGGHVVSGQKVESGECGGCVDQQIAAAEGDRLLMGVADGRSVTVQFQVDEFSERFQAHSRLIEAEAVLLAGVPVSADAPDAVGVRIVPAVSGAHIGTEFRIRGQNGPKIAEPQRGFTVRQQWQKPVQRRVSAAVSESVADALPRADTRHPDVLRRGQVSRRQQHDDRAEPQQSHHQTGTRCRPQYTNTPPRLRPRIMKSFRVTFCRSVPSKPPGVFMLSYTMLFVGRDVWPRYMKS